jgi:hypothetical protein
MMPSLDRSSAAVGIIRGTTDRNTNSTSSAYSPLPPSSHRILTMRAASILALTSLLLLSLVAVTLAGRTAPPPPGGGTLPLYPGQLPIGPQYISSAIVWALLAGLLLIFVLYIGVSCIMGVERPVRMTAVPLQLGKEY